MPQFVFNKLVRDKVVQLCLDDPLVPETEYRTLSLLDFKQALKDKVAEEAAEIPVQEEVDDEVIGEIADIQEVIDAIKAAYGVDNQAVKDMQIQKAHKKGAFEKRHFIESVVCDETSPWTAMFRGQPKKYPEIGAKKPKLPSRPDLALGRYRHYKGGEYEAVMLAMDEATERWCVVYKALYETKDNPKVWIRTVEDFTAILDNGRKRFEKVSDAKA